MLYFGISNSTAIKRAGLVSALLFIFFLVDLSQIVHAAPTAVTDKLVQQATRILRDNFGLNSSQFVVQKNANQMTVYIIPGLVDDDEVIGTLLALTDIKQIGVRPLKIKHETKTQAESASTKTWKLLPTDAVFDRPLADPLRPRFYIASRQASDTYPATNVGSVGLGEDFGLLAGRNTLGFNALDISIQGFATSDFDMAKISRDLLVHDYLIAGQLAVRRNAVSSAFRYYHQSSHKGDDYIGLSGATYQKVDYNAVEWLLAYTWKGARIYVGGEYLLPEEPENIDQAVARAGIDYRGAMSLWGVGRWMMGADVRALQLQDYYNNTRLVFGTEFFAGKQSSRSLSLLATYYTGYSYHLQLFQEQSDYTGLELVFGF